MQPWQIDLLDTLDGVPDEAALRSRLRAATQALGFEHFAYGLRLLRARVIDTPRPRLTPREIEMLQWTAEGKTAGEIADLLTLSDHTVQFHLKNAAAKLHCANKTAAAVRAALLGLLH